MDSPEGDCSSPCSPPSRNAGAKNSVTWSGLLPEEEDSPRSPGRDLDVQLRIDSVYLARRRLSSKSSDSGNTVDPESRTTSGDEDIETLSLDDLNALQMPEDEGLEEKKTKVSLSGFAEGVKKVGRLIARRRTSLEQPPGQGQASSSARRRSCVELPAGQSQGSSSKSSLNEQEQSSVQESDPSMHVKFHDIVEVLELEASSPTSVPAAA